MRKFLLSLMLALLPMAAFAVTENYDAYNGFKRPPGKNGAILRVGNNTTSVTIVRPDVGALCLHFEPPVNGSFGACTDTSPSTVCGNTGFPAATSNTTAWEINPINVFLDNIHSSPTSVVYFQNIDSATITGYKWYTRCK